MTDETRERKMVDVGVKLSFARSQMIFNCDFEVNFADYLSSYFYAKQIGSSQDEYNNDNETARKPSLRQHISGSFTFASLMEDFVTGSRVHLSHSHAYWTKFFLFSGPDYQPFYPNFNPSFSRHAALEYSIQRQLSDDCLSFSIRRRFAGFFSLVASASWVSGPQTLSSSGRRCFWTVGLVTEDKKSGLEMLASFNREGNLCVGFKKEIGDSGAALRLGAVVKGTECPEFNWRKCFEIGLEMI